MNETLVQSLNMQEHVEVLPLPSYSGDKQFTLLLSDSGGDGLCCDQGNGGPVELFDVPISDDNLLFQDLFQGSRISFSFVRTGEASSSGTRETSILLSLFLSIPLLLWLV